MSNLLNELKTKFNKARSSFCFEVTPDNMIKLIRHIEKLEQVAPLMNDKYAIKAKEGEPVFILLGHDPLAPGIVRLWASHKAITDGPSDHTAAANNKADEMEKYGASL